MHEHLLRGKLVRLTARDERDVDTIAGWDRDTHYNRLLSVEPVTPPDRRAVRKMVERELNPKFYPFGVRTLNDDKLIGFVVLMHVDHVHGDAFVGIGIGDGEYRGKGYGSDAMNVVLRFAFLELNLHRVSLDAVSTNTPAIRSYVKVGFVHEGGTRGTEHRGGKREDLVSMGILRSEWQARQEHD